jgi:small subunit ribosomal protein S7
MRKGSAKIRPLLPDPKYKDPLVTRIANNIMKSGKKGLAYTILYTALDMITEKTGEAGIEVLKKALHNISPTVETKRRRVGGATLQVPIEVREHRKIYLAIKWLLDEARSRSGEKTMEGKLAYEIIAASKEEGKAFKKKVDMHKMAESNRAFSHFRI